MKIVLYEPSLIVRGMLTWLRHIRHGLEELGHECQLLTVTKSGAASIRWTTDVSTLNKSSGLNWSPLVPDVAVSPHEALSHLVSWGTDLVIIPEPRSLHPDGVAWKADAAIPFYVWLLDQLGRKGIPWTTVVHGQIRDYASKRTPYTETLLRTSGFSGRMLAHFPVGDTGTMAPFTDIELVESPLPYRPSPSDTDVASIDRWSRVGITGRLQPNKGQHVLAWLAAQRDLPGVNQVDLAGSTSIGTGPNFTYLIYEMLHGLGGECQRHGIVKEDVPVERHWTGGDVTSAPRWEVKFPGRPEIRFTGSYGDELATCRSFGVHVNLTAGSFTTAFTEYSTLEAIDAGCVVVAPERLLGASFRGARVAYGQTISLERLVTPRDGDGHVVEGIVTRLREALDVARDPLKRDIIQRHNAEALRCENSPSRVAQRLLNLVFDTR